MRYLPFVIVAKEYFVNLLRAYLPLRVTFLQLVTKTIGENPLLVSS
jgi:hypothetical protein